MEEHNGIDIYALYHDGRIVPATCVHHIREALDAPELFYAEGNHIPVSDESHAEIHRRYREEDEAAVREELEGYLEKWQEEKIEFF